MTDDRPHSPNPLVPGLIGGLVGAALTQAAQGRNAAQLRTELEQIAQLERDRVAREKERHELALTEAQNQETDRAYHRDVLWLSHCDNEERLDYLIARNRETLVHDLAVRVASEAWLHPSAVASLAALADTRARLDLCRQQHRAWQQEAAALQRARWTAGRIFLTGLCGGSTVLVFLGFAVGSRVLPYAYLSALLLAVLSPFLPRLQPPPARARRGDAPMPSRTFAQHQARHALVGTLRVQEMARLGRQLAAHDEELRHWFATNQSVWRAATERQVGVVRSLIEAAQCRYPPRVRCDLSAFSDAALLACLPDTLSLTFATQFDRLLSA